MSYDRIVGCFVPQSTEVPEPLNALLFVETSSGGRELHVCYSCDQVQAGLSAYPLTHEDDRDDVNERLAETPLPESSAASPLVIRESAAAYLIAAAIARERIRQEDVVAFCSTGANCFLYLPETAEEGTQGVLSVCDVDGECFLFVAGSRDRLRPLLQRYVPMMDDGGEQLDRMMALLDRSTLPEAGRALTRIDGAVAAMFVCVLFCLDEYNRSQAS